MNGPTRTAPTPECSRTEPTLHRALHLEIRHQYGIGDEAEEIALFARTNEIALDPTAGWWP
ncbi:hypothetical protein [Streptomyces sp. NPDC002215]|uniref:hypothetical protein n=1 Tax=Streptomyces sp. NPDC002215 TaxID=3154412 RepID=UPI00332F39D3